MFSNKLLFFCAIGWTLCFGSPAFALKASLIDDSVTLLDEVAETVGRAELEFVFLVPKARCALPPPQKALLFFTVTPATNEQWALHLMCERLSAELMAANGKPFKVRVVDADAADASAAADAARLGVFEGATSRFLAVVRWDVELGLMRGHSQRDNLWAAAEIAVFDVASRRLVWHGLERAGASYLTDGGARPRLANVEYTANNLLFQTFNAFNGGPRLRAIQGRLGFRLLSPRAFAEPVETERSRLYMRNTSNTQAVVFVCPVAGAGAPADLPRAESTCAPSQRLAHGTYAVMDLPPGQYLAVANLDDRTGVVLNLARGAIAGLNTRNGPLNVRYLTNADISPDGSGLQAWLQEYRHNRTPEAAVLQMLAPQLAWRQP